MKFPKNHQMFITRNGHRTNYESVQEYITELDRDSDMLPEDIKECIEKDEIWEVQWYPLSPISFFWIAAASLERCLEIIETSGMSK